MDIFESRYNALNQSQKDAVDTIDGPVLVIAGPGTGKTELLSLRAGNILKQTDTPESSILCLTFTQSGSENIKNRIKTILGKKNTGVNVYTFHAFASDIIAQNQEYFFNGIEFSPIDDITADSFLTEIIDNLKPYDPLKTIGIDGNFYYFKGIKDRITDLKGAGLTPDDFDLILDLNKSIIEEISSKFAEVFDGRIETVKIEKINEFLEFLNSVTEKYKHNRQNFSDDIFQLYSSRMANDLVNCLEYLIDNSKKKTKKENSLKLFRDRYSKKIGGVITLIDYQNHVKYTSLSNIYRQYQEKLRTSGFYDYQDMILRVIEAFERYPDLKYKYQEKFLYIMIDEFQDTNGAQIKLVESIVDLSINENKPNILVVGDDDQAIFKFQKASVDHINRFRLQYNSVKIITLTENYRSKQPILDFAQQIISNANNRLADLEGVDKRIISKVDYGN
jgi:DNA helicase-2/ATP-dependent DNA helicase PcrA